MEFWFHFYNHTDCPAWVSIEVNSAMNLSIPGLLSSHLPLPPNNSSDSPVVRHTLRAWVQFRKHFFIFIAFLFWVLSCLIIFSNLHLTIPCSKYGTDRASSILRTCTLIFLHLSNSYLKNINCKRLFFFFFFFRYLQMRHFLKSQTPNKTKFSKLFLQSLTLTSHLTLWLLSLALREMFLVWLRISNAHFHSLLFWPDGRYY